MELAAPKTDALPFRKVRCIVNPTTIPLAKLTQPTQPEPGQNSISSWKLPYIKTKSKPVVYPFMSKKSIALVLFYLQGSGF
jgi:hypothetical protein